MEKIKKEFKSHRNHIGKNLFWSYIIIAVLAIIFNIIIYAYTVNHIHSGIRQTHASEAEKLSYQLNAIIDEALTQTTKLSRQPLVETVLGVSLKERYFGQEALDVRQMLDEFGEAMGYYDSLASLTLYDLRQEALITRDSDNTLSIYHDAQAVDYMTDTLGIAGADLDRAAANERLGIYIVPGSGEDRPWRLFYIVSLYTDTYNRPAGLLLGEISSAKINEILDMYNYEGHRYYLVSDARGYLGEDGQAAETVEAIRLADTDTDGLHKFRQGYTSMVYTKIRTTLPDLYCYYVTPYTQYYGALWAALLLMLLNVLAIIAIVIFLARRFERKNTEPLRRMLRAVAPDANGEADLTYNYMETRIRSVMDKMQGLERFWKNDFVSVILNGQETDRETILEYERKNVPPCTQGYRVLCARLQNISDQSDMDVLLFCISNILGELLDEINVGSPVKTWNSVYFILRNDADMTVCQDIVKKGIQFMDQRLTITIALGLSAPFADYTAMPGARRQADYAVEFAELTGTFNLIVWHEYITEAALGDDRKYGAKLQSLMKKLLARDYRTSREILDNLWENHIRIDSYDGYDMNMRRDRMLAIVSIISVSHRENGGLMELYHIRQKSLKDLYQIAGQMLDELIGSRDGGEDGRKVFDKISSFIRENYRDLNLSAGYICDHFHLSYSYVTGLFKKYSGDSVFDYIHKIRVEAAKIMLAEGRTVTETATTVGYGDARGFIRAFKRYEGMTPGQYKMQ